MNSSGFHGVERLAVGFELGRVSAGQSRGCRWVCFHLRYQFQSVSVGIFTVFNPRLADGKVEHNKTCAREHEEKHEVS